MDHVELHRHLSESFTKLKSGILKPQLAKEIFNGAGKMINLAKAELTAIDMGAEIEVPLLGLRKGEIKKSKEAKKL